MNEEIFQQLLPEEHLLRYLSKEIRSDDRKFTESRNLKIIMDFIPSFDGSSILTLGETNVICTLQSELIDKKITTTQQQNKVEDYHFFDLAISIGKYEIEEGDVTERNKMENYYEKYLESLFVPQLKEYMVHMNEGFKNKRRLLKLQAKVLKNNGNLLSGLYLAIFFALYSAQIPTRSKENENALNYTERLKIGLKMGDLFFPLSVNQLFSKYLIFDPTAEEELFSDYAITFFLNVVTNDSIIHKLNGKSVSFEKLMELKQECSKILTIYQKKLANFFGNPNQPKILELSY